MKTLKNNKLKEDILFNNILLLARNKMFYTKFNLTDSFHNRIHLIFIHVSFLFIKIKKEKGSSIYSEFYQNTFDLMFNRIELNMREIGFGDVVINKNMKFLVKTFYNILLKCENYKEMKFDWKNTFFSKYLKYSTKEKAYKYVSLTEYFDKYQAFCFDLSSDSVLKGNLKFNYK